MLEILVLLVAFALVVTLFLMISHTRKERFANARAAAMRRHPSNFRRA